MSITINESHSLFFLSFWPLCFFHFYASSLTPSVATSPTIPPLNISHFLYPFSNDVMPLQHPSNYHPFFKDVLKAIATKEKWNLEDIRASRLDVNKVKFGGLQRYEFRVRFGKSDFVFKLLDQVSSWKRLESVENESHFQALVGELNSKAVLETLEIEGPFHLSVRGDHELTLRLPFNRSFPGLKHIHIGEGITVKVIGVVEVSLFHSTDFRKKFNGSALSRLERSELGYFWPTLCRAWPPIWVSGSAAVVAYRTRSPEAFIETAFLSNRTVELLPGKCYSRRIYQVGERVSPINFLTTRIALLERVLQTFVGHKSSQNASSSSVKVKIMASSMFRFQLELEREIRSNDTYWSAVAEWRTRPTVERLWFEVVGRLEAEVMKPLTIKKIRPFIEVESKALSNLFSNVSFTKFPSFLVPQEALTLDVKW